MKFEEDPDYDYIKGLIKNVFTRENYVYDYKFDWNIASLSFTSSTHLSAKLQNQTKKELSSRQEITLDQKDAKYEIFK